MKLSVPLVLIVAVTALAHAPHRARGQMTSFIPAPPLPKLNVAIDSREWSPVDADGAGVPSLRTFPKLPPDPNAAGLVPLPPLEEELRMHGGAHLYEPEGDAALQYFGLPGDHGRHLRLPETWQKPLPHTFFAEFLGTGPIRPWPHLRWFGDGFQWEPRGVVYGRYDLIGFALEEGNTRQDAVGQQLILDFDLRLTGTERFHVQYRPIGEDNSGGSFYQFNDPNGYIDNSTGVPSRYWFEGELFSMFGGLFATEFVPRDYHVAAGKFAFQLQNELLINDEVLGVAVNKNTIYCGNLSNLNIQTFGFFDVDAFDDVSSNVVGTDVSADFRKIFFEGTYAFLDPSQPTAGDAHYGAFSATKFFGPFSVAARTLLKWGDGPTTGDGQLYVIETNWTRTLSGAFAHRCDIEYGVIYANAFKATSGWSPISGGNFNRLRSSFEVNPLVTIARGVVNDAYGAAVGVQFFRHNEDQSISPEIAYEAPQGTAVWGVGLRFQQKNSSRSFLEVLGVVNWSDDPNFDREGIFVSQSVLF